MNIITPSLIAQNVATQQMKPPLVSTSEIQQPAKKILVAGQMAMPMPLIPLDNTPLPLIPVSVQESDSSQKYLPQDPLANLVLPKQPKVTQPSSQAQSLKTKKRTKKHTQQQTQSPNKVPIVPLNFDVENQTGKTVYVTCFSYIKKRPFTRWRWDKSSIYKLEHQGTATIDIDKIEDEQDRNNVFAYLAVLDTEKEAQDAVYELLDDSKKIELDQLIHLRNKKVVIEVEKYGVLGEFYDYDFVKKTQPTSSKSPELDFLVENQTGKKVYVTCFVYEKKAKGTWLAKKTKEAWTTVDESRDDMSVWRFDKTPIITLTPGESGLINVDTIVEPRDRDYVRGYLAIYDEDERKDAELDIYELLATNRKRDLGVLKELKDKKIILNVEQYGVVGEFIDFVVKPVQRIDFSKFKQ